MDRRLAAYYDAVAYRRGAGYAHLAHYQAVPAYAHVVRYVHQVVYLGAAADDGDGQRAKLAGVTPARLKICARRR